MPAREDILHKVRTALGRSAGPPLPSKSFHQLWRARRRKF